MVLLGASTLLGCAATPPPATQASTGQAAAVPAVLVSDTVATQNQHNDTTSTKELVGKKCRLQFRRDALGLNAPGILEPTATSSGGKAVSIVGTVDQVTDGWVVMHVNKQVYWIPTTQILMLELAE